jgi:hypothetical protein
MYQMAVGTSPTENNKSSMPHGLVVIFVKEDSVFLVPSGL